MIRQLHQKKFRNEKKLFIAEGEKVVDALLHSGYETIFIIATEGWSHERAGGIETEIVSEDELHSLSLLEKANKVLAIVRRPELMAPELKRGCNYLLLDDIRDPGNLGTIIRIADWFDFEAVICTPDCVEFYNPKVIQAAMGSLFYKKLHVCTPPELINGNKIPVYGAMLAGRNMYEVPFEPGILLIGNESRGIGEELKRIVTQPVSIPAYSLDKSAESLNAAVACGILCAQMKHAQIKNPAYTGSD